MFLHSLSSCPNRVKISRKDGDALERAVRAIELAILKQAPGYTEKTVRIEGKNASRATLVFPTKLTYGSLSRSQRGTKRPLFFECKNWRKKVGKKEAADFARKIEDAKAQRGFLVAAALTKGASAIVNSDQRMEWLVARELSAEEVPERVRRFYGVFAELKDEVYHILQSEDGVDTVIDMEKAVFTVDGPERNLLA